MVSPGVFADLAAQRACWHPVAFAADVSDRPVHADLLGEALVLWRGAGRGHRAVAGLGRRRRAGLPVPRVAVRGRRPLRGDPAEGGSGRGPGQGPSAGLPRAERYGLIWVALEEPRWPLPSVPELEADGWAVVAAGPYRWECDAARQVENFTDFGHFPWVHSGLLGDPERPVVPPYAVTTDGPVLRYDIVLDQPDQVIREFEDTIFGQDQVELHLRFDAVAVAYRKAMRDVGLAAGSAIGTSVE